MKTGNGELKTGHKVLGDQFWTLIYEKELLHTPIQETCWIWI